MARSLPSCFSIQFLEQLLKFLVNFTLLKYVKSQRSYGLLITKELIFGFQILDLKDHFSASLKRTLKCLLFRLFQLLKCFQSRLKFTENYTIATVCSLLHIFEENKLYFSYSGCHEKF